MITGISTDDRSAQRAEATAGHALGRGNILRTPAPAAATLSPVAAGVAGLLNTPQRRRLIEFYVIQIWTNFEQF